MLPPLKTSIRRLPGPAALAIVASLASLAACAPVEAPPRAAPQAPASTAPRAPIVVVVVLDQVGSWVLERARPSLPPSGLLRRCMAQGAYHQRTVYEHAGTLTAPGHAVISTGAPPAVSGIDSNRRYVDGLGKRSIVDDAKYPLFGDPSVGASPVSLLTPSVSDLLDEHTGGAAQIVSVSVKDRAAVLLGGKKADVALFLDGKTGTYTTSSYYAQTLPAWLATHQRAHPLASYSAPWLPLDLALLAAHTDGDEGPGEGDMEGFGVVFPHDSVKTRDPVYLHTFTPGAVDMMLDVARAAVAAHHLGEDEVTDLLWLSVSTTDHVGHTFGAESWEMLDTLLRVDAALGVFVAELERRAPVRLLVTADHGIVPMVERSRALGIDARRWTDAEMFAAVDEALSRRFGQGKYAIGFGQPYLYLAPSARTPEHQRLAAEALSRVPGIAQAYAVTDVAGATAAPESLRSAVAQSIAPGTRGDVFVVPGLYSSYDDDVPHGAGVSHGSPWPYDREVPVIVCGAGVGSIETTQALSASRIATTIAALAGVPGPPGAGAEPLPGVRLAPR
jgi:hypothetical protein